SFAMTQEFEPPAIGELDYDLSLHDEWMVFG
ncbi:MAG: hypothetical protein ACI9LS_001701, partial [Flavobacteriales bacterium]